MMVVLLMTRRILKRGLTGLLSLMLGVFLFEFVQPLVADSMGGGEGLATMMERLPPAFQSVIKARPEFIAVSGLDGYLSIGFTHPLFYVLTIAALVSAICRSLAGEIESGSMELVISRSVSRTRVYVSRLIAIAITIVFLVASAIAGLAAGIAAGRPDGAFSWGHLPSVAATVALLLASISGVTLACAAISNTTTQAVGRATAFVVVSFIINYLAAIWTVIEPFDPISVFAWYNPVDAFVSGTLDTLDIVILGSVSVAGAIVGGILFARRDLPA